MADFTIHDEGTIMLVRPRNETAVDWIDENYPECMWWGGAMVVDNSYKQMVLECITNAGIQWELEE